MHSSFYCLHAPFFLLILVLIKNHPRGTVLVKYEIIIGFEWLPSQRHAYSHHTPIYVVGRMKPESKRLSFSGIQRLQRQMSVLAAEQEKQHRENNAGDCLGERLHVFL